MRNKNRQQHILMAKKNSGFRQNSVILFIILLLVFPPLFANMGSSSFMDSVITQSESNVSDQELTRFGVALIDIQEIQREATQHIHTSIEKASISGERLDEIFLLQRENPEKLEQEVSSKEIEEFSQVMSEIAQIYQSTEIKIEDSLKKKSYDIESFNQMATKIEKDPELLNRLQTLFNGPQEGI